jgi:hypothetical protein
MSSLETQEFQAARAQGNPNQAPAAIYDWAEARVNGHFLTVALCVCGYCTSSV